MDRHGTFQAETRIHRTEACPSRSGLGHMSGSCRPADSYNPSHVFSAQCTPCTSCTSCIVFHRLGPMQSCRPTDVHRPGASFCMAKFLDQTIQTDWWSTYCRPSFVALFFRYIPGIPPYCGDWGLGLADPWVISWPFRLIRIWRKSRCIHRASSSDYCTGNVFD